jgi:phosphate transport system permease protein
MNKYWKRGEPWVWIGGGALAAILLITATLLIVVFANGMGIFWPGPVEEMKLTDGGSVIGEVMKREPVPNSEGSRIQLKTGNRDVYGLDFRWIKEEDIAEHSRPDSVLVIERKEYGNFVGYIHEVQTPTFKVAGVEANRKALEKARAEIRPYQHEAEKLSKEIQKVTRADAKARLEAGKLRHRKGRDVDVPLPDSLSERLDQLKGEFKTRVAEQDELLSSLDRYSVVMREAGGSTRTIPLDHLVRVMQPNRMSLSAKVGCYVSRIKELLVEEPRESNTEGGLFPAIVGTVMLVFLMSALSFPLGVMAGVYLREYAKDGVMVRMVRIAVNNLAGVPSIVYGVFGLGFFVYGIGGTLDALFFSDRLPAPTFGTGGILWASLTLGLLTVPVVIVSTEEAFGAIPQGVRQASMALGATRFQTLVKVLFPMASPGILTGFILAMARAAGEVAPLMITGVVKLAPALPLDGQYPFLHLDRKFMHLGFHIYDIGFQSPNVEAAKPMVFVTTLLLVLIVLLMSSTAIILRERMKRKYTIKSF